MQKLKSLCIGAGHAATGKGASGAVGYINESDEARNIRNRIVFFNALGDKKRIVDCTEDYGTQSKVLTSAVKKANSSGCDLNIQIHFNASKKSAKDGKTKGVECLVYSADSSAVPYARYLCEEISKSMKVTNRGVKVNKNLYFLKKTKKPSIILEVCFCDDEDDFIKYTNDIKKNVFSVEKAVLSLLK